jgi:hypothetical protein
MYAKFCTEGDGLWPNIVQTPKYDQSLFAIAVLIQALYYVGHRRQDFGKLSKLETRTEIAANVF